MQTNEQTNEHADEPRTEGTSPGDYRERRSDGGAERAHGHEGDVAERPGSTQVEREHADALADEWGEESFPVSDPPAHY
ncbi:hypothetical protein NHL51_02765 [Leucobacter sp. gxy201]|uniref:hypothetical protein n=1 Tax=Leucobacter sp. gxy201 TaxID=2957200 RepID=UPI003DA0E317